jgi:hypothetical protein
LPAHFGFGLLAADNATGVGGWMPASGVPWDYAYTYLTGGVNTAGAWWNGWAADGTFPIHYGANAASHGYIPVFVYYTSLASSGSCNRCEAHQKAFTNLNNPGLMQRYYQNFALLMQRLSARTYGGIQGLGQTAIIDIEPDLSGFVEQAVNGANCFKYCTARGNNPANLVVSVAGSGAADVAGYPNT